MSILVDKWSRVFTLNSINYSLIQYSLSTYYISETLVSAQSIAISKTYVIQSIYSIDGDTGVLTCAEKILHLKSQNKDMYKKLCDL